MYDCLRKDLRVLIFVNLKFFVVDGLQPAAVDVLEVPCEVTVTMSGSVVNHLLFTRYEKLLNELYIEPKNEEIVGKVLRISLFFGSI